MVYTHEATTTIHFPTDRQFAAYREDIEERYDGAMVRVERVSVSHEGTTAAVHHARGLGAELKGRAYGHFDGSTVSTVYPNEEK